MSLHITAYCPEGIVMASDSRVTLRRYRREADGALRLTGVETQDGANKLFAVNRYIALSLSGSLDIDGEDILSLVPRFIKSRADKCSDAEKAAELLLEYFGESGEAPDTCFHIAGYAPESGKKSICRVFLRGKRIERTDCSKPGMIYNGDTMFAETVMADPRRSPEQCSLQELAEAAEKIIRLTGQKLPLQDGVRTVGGPVDMLQIQPDGVRWLQCKNQ